MRFTQEHETRIVIDGAEYHAQTAAPGGPPWLGDCDGCAFYSGHGCETTVSHVDMPCMCTFRTDKTSIIWVRA